MKIFFIVFFMAIPAYSIGGPSVQPGISWIEQWDVLRIIVGSLFLIVGFFLVRTLTKFDKNQDLIFERLRETENELAELKGRCEATNCLRMQ